MSNSAEPIRRILSKLRAQGAEPVSMKRSDLETQIKDMTDDLVLIDWEIECVQPDCSVIAHSRDGWISAVIYPNGSAELSVYSKIPRHLRTVSHREISDVHFTVQIEEFVKSLQCLIECADLFIDEAIDRKANAEANALKHLEQFNREEFVSNPPDPDDELMKAEGAKYGFGKIEPHHLPYKLAEAVGITVRKPQKDHEDKPRKTAQGDVIYGDLLPFETVRASVIDYLKKPAKPESKSDKK